MTAHLRVDTTSPVPPYEQIRAQLAALIEHGVLPARERLPPLRQLAADLGLAVGTVARAYRELELSGLVTSRRGGGTRVADVAPSQDRDRLLAEHAAAYVAVARRLGATDEQAVTAVRQSLLKSHGER
ncbi:GntR family transcriptional regulator [Actinoplanes sp. L3-i22]|uniref:GntR family transcriptional regulator n=1 Tax=Actinoplanes sp. L3-i22 TaxID=2836373 RepID=UPI001C78E0E0|nr:GntR family transcriptional regulator [Actinoplanes sp. L3-i22]BCY07142.1 GntR family transcriptional regulator [Actinoplanes sp. L3-i22]